VWREGAYEVAASWWEDWTEWIAQRAGEQVSPPSVGSSKYPATDDAPGSYVLEK
jgi:polyhydroxyalkanoate synthase